jgi:hypothetical protein
MQRGRTRLLVLTAATFMAVAACGGSRDSPAGPDADAPTLDVAAIPDTVRAERAEVVVEVSAADDAGLARIFFSVNGGAEQSTALSGQRAYGTRLTIPLVAGVNDLVFGAADLAGNRTVVDDRVVYRRPGE